jgi:hypothetical protein
MSVFLLDTVSKMGRFGHGVQRENGVLPMESVHAAAAALLHRVAEGGEIPMAVLHEFAQLMLRLELVEVSRQALEGPPQFAVRRALELSSLVLGVRIVSDVEEGVQ